MTLLPALPVLVPLVTALVLLAIEGRWRAQAVLSTGSAVALVAVAIAATQRTWSGEVLALRVGSWAPSVGIVWVIDRLAAAMLVLGSLTGLAVVVYAPASLRRHERRFVFPLIQLLLLGVNGSFVTGDFFNLFVFFEVMLVASFVLISQGGGAARLRQAFPYVVVNLVASALFFAGVGMLYGTMGTVDMAELAVRVHGWGPPPAVFWAALAITLVVFGVKAALAPVFMWLPDSYPRAPLPVSALFAGLLTKVGVYALFRTTTLLMDGRTEAPMLHVLLAVSAATMLLGVLGALGRTGLRDILSFHIVSQVGYMVFGLALFTVAGVAAGIFYVIHHILVKTALFLAVGYVELGQARGARARGVATAVPWAGAAFFVPAMALAGIPPASGFWGKLFLVLAGFQAGAWVTTAVAVLVSLLTLASMLKIWFGTYWGAPAALRPRRVHGPRILGPPVALAALSLAIGATAPILWAHARRTATDLLTRTPYVTGVLAASSARPGGSEVAR